MQDRHKREKKGCNLLMQDRQNENVPNIVQNRAGWYPRWWLLAALCYCIIMIILMLLWRPVICPAQHRQSLPIVCQVTNWWDPIKVFLFWLIFVTCWLMFVLFGIGLVEVPRLDENPLGNFLRKLSQFSALHYMLLLQGMIAFILINVMWWLDRSPPAAFATLGIVVFLAHCSLFNCTPRASRRGYTLAYAVFTLINLAVQMTFKRDFFTRPRPSDEWPLLCIEFIRIVIGIAAFFYRPRYTQHPTAQAAQNAHIDQTIQPLNILRNMWPFSRLFPPQPPQILTDDDLPGNPDSGAP